MRESTKNTAGFPVKGMFGDFGGCYVPENLTPVLQEIAAEYEKCKSDSAFRDEYLTLLKDYVGRPSALTECKNLTSKNGGARIFLNSPAISWTAPPPRGCPARP